MTADTCARCGASKDRHAMPRLTGACGQFVPDLLTDNAVAALAAHPETGATPTHRIVWEHDGDTIFAKFHCDAGEWADCRVTCAEDCEQWSGQSDDNRTHETDDPGGTHAMRPLSYCNPIEWIENDGSEQEMYDGPAAPVHSGPVEFVWDGDGYRWHYAATPHPDTERADALDSDRKRLYSINASSALDDHMDAVRAFLRMAEDGITAREALDAAEERARTAEAEVERLKGVIEAMEDDSDIALIERAEAVEAESQIADQFYAALRAMAARCWMLRQVARESDTRVRFYQHADTAWRDDLIAARAEATAAREVVAQVRALHGEVRHLGESRVCGFDFSTYPCATIRALDSTPSGEATT